MRRSKLSTVVGVLVGLIAASSPAAVLRVDKTQPAPPGVYSTIQAAVDASAPNDTISIANGRYEELERYAFPSGDVAFANTIVEVGPLTLIGDSRDGVRIGRTYYVGPIGDGLALGFGALAGTEHLTIKSLTLENMYYLLTTAASLTLIDCRMTTPGHGFSLFSPEFVHIEDCVFEDIPEEDAIFATYSQSARTQLLRIENTRFANCAGGLSLLGVDQVEIIGTRFTNCVVGTQFDDDTVGTITDSWYENCGYSMRMLDGSSCHLERVVSLENISQGLYSDNGHFTGSHNYIEGGAGAAVQIRGTGTASIQNSTLLNGGGWTVHIGARKSYFPIVPRFDFTSNYWGTTDTDQIRTWILDEEENPLLVGVDFEPILPESPVSTQATSVGRVKAMFEAQQR